MSFDTTIYLYSSLGADLCIQLLMDRLNTILQDIGVSAFNSLSQFCKRQLT